MKNNIPEINLNLTTKTVVGGEKIKLTVRNVFYVGFLGKLKTFFFWLIYNRDVENVSFKTYLNSPIKYTIEEPLIRCYHAGIGDKEFEKFLEEELKKNNNL